VSLAGLALACGLRHARFSAQPPSHRQEGRQQIRLHIARYLVCTATANCTETERDEEDDPSSLGTPWNLTTVPSNP
jgi:hypothetical protein